MRRTILLAVLAVAQTAAGGASAYALRTVFLKPGHCAKVHGTKVCARSVKPKLVTVTVAPSPVGQTFNGNGDQTLAPVTLAHGVTVHWTAQPDSDGFNEFDVTSSAGDTTFVQFDNGNGRHQWRELHPAGDVHARRLGKRRLDDLVLTFGSISATRAQRRPWVS
jgi:hypothetical protein